MRMRLCAVGTAAAFAATTGTAVLTGQAPAGQSVTWVKYVDPAERAFTIDVPGDYRVEGGTVRASSIDPRANISATAPDASIRIQIGDPAIPNFSEPNQITQAQGLREGMSYQLSGGQRLTLSRYAPGVEFAYEYGRRLMLSVCANPQLKAARPVPNPSRFSYWGSAGTAVASGEAYFLCPAQGKVGYAFVSTAETRMQGSAVWTVPAAMSFVAQTARAGAAMSIALHMSYSIVVDQNWMAQLLRAQGAYGDRAAANFRAQLAADAEQMHRIDEHQRSTFQAMDDIIAGVTPTVDPLTGERRELLTGAGSYYWADGQGRTATTKSYIAPGPDYHPLQVLPR